jgi:FKBP-type peptidyl-prolyl cis-trans isomerase FkpA/FKBP-type peptidyl-prolyl cis-trans isomerase FklB
MLTDGTKFDSSLDRGEPAVFGVTQVIKGWTEGLQIMPVGSKYEFWIPSDMAYGENGSPRAGIKPNSVLHFEVELLEIVKE